MFITYLFKQLYTISQLFLVKINIDLNLFRYYVEFTNLVFWDLLNQHLDLVLDFNTHAHRVRYRSIIEAMSFIEASYGIIQGEERKIYNWFLVLITNVIKSIMCLFLW